MEFDDRLTIVLISSGMTLVVTVLGIWIKGYFQGRKERVTETKSDLEKHKDKVDSEIKELSKFMHEFKEEVSKSYYNLKEMIGKIEIQQSEERAELRTRIEVLGQQQQHYSESVVELKGRVDQQMDLVSSHISTLGHMSRQLERIFQFIDAPKRATDTAMENENTQG